MRSPPLLPRKARSSTVKSVRLIRGRLVVRLHPRLLPHARSSADFGAPARDAGGRWFESSRAYSRVASLVGKAPGSYPGERGSSPRQPTSRARSSTGSERQASNLEVGRSNLSGRTRCQVAQPVARRIVTPRLCGFESRPDSSHLGLVQRVARRALNPQIGVRILGPRRRCGWLGLAARSVS